MMRRELVSAMVAVFGVLALAAGVSLADPGAGGVAAVPKTTPSRTITNFSEALTCVDGLLARHGVSGIVLTNGGIADSTGKAAVGTNEMVITAISLMTRQSQALTFIDYDTSSNDLAQLTADVRAGRKAPILAAYYLRGAITSFDENVSQWSAAGKVTVARKNAAATGLTPAEENKLLKNLEIQDSREQLVSMISMDINIGDARTREMIPEASASNSVAMVQAGRTRENGGKIAKMGVNYTLRNNEAEGKGAAVRALTELGLIEAVGRLTQIPYWECLAAERTDPTHMRWAREIYDELGEERRTDFVLRGLRRLGYLPASGSSPEPLASVIARYQARSDQVPTGRIDFDLYYKLMALDPAAAAATPAEPAKRLAVDVSSDAGGSTFKKGQAISLILSPQAEGDAYCFMREPDNVLIRVFPNRFQASPSLNGSASIMVPPAQRRSFSMVLDKAPGRVVFTCFSLPRSGGGVEATLGPDLRPLDFDEQEIERRLTGLSPSGLERVSLSVNVQ